MKIIDVNGKERNIASIKRIIHKVPDRITGDLIDVEFVEVEIIGRYRKNWTEWYPLDRFIELNPTINI